MIIKEIELNNFRIYKGENTINLTTKGKKKHFYSKWEKWLWENNFSNVDGLVYVW